MTDFLFLISKITADGDGNHEIRRLVSWEESYDKPRQCVEKQRHYSADKGQYSQGYGLPSGHFMVVRAGWYPLQYSGLENSQRVGHN